MSLSNPEDNAYVRLGKIVDELLKVEIKDLTTVKILEYHKNLHDLTTNSEERSDGWTHTLENARTILKYYQTALNAFHLNHLDNANFNLGQIYAELLNKGMYLTIEEVIGYVIKLDILEQNNNKKSDQWTGMFGNCREILNDRRDVLFADYQLKNMAPKLKAKSINFAYGLLNNMESLKTFSSQVLASLTGNCVATFLKDTAYPYLKKYLKSDNSANGTGGSDISANDTSGSDISADNNSASDN